jgi:hypothetical protein
MLPFTHAILDDDGNPIRKFRWSNSEAKWFTNTHPYAIIIKLPKEKQVKQDYLALLGECLF